MAVTLEQTKVNEIDRLINVINVNVENVNNVLNDLESRFQKHLVIQEEVIQDHHKLIHQQDEVLDKLQAKLLKLEENVVFPSHLSNLNERMYDDNDQNARKLNLKIDGIPLFYDDSPEQIISYIKLEVNRLDLDITDVKFGAAHRVGAKTFKDNKQHQSVVLKMTCPLARTKMYMNRNNFKFQLQVDLTSGREETLNFAKHQISNGVNPAARRVVEFIYADLKGTLNLKSKAGQFYGFSSESEFLSLVTWLDKQENFRQQSFT